MHSPNGTRATVILTHRLYFLGYTGGLDDLNNEGRIARFLNDFVGQLHNVVCDASWAIVIGLKFPGSSISSIGYVVLVVLLEVGPEKVAKLALVAAGIVLLAWVATGIGLGGCLKYGGIGISIFDVEEPLLVMGTLPVVEATAKRSADDG